MNILDSKVAVITGAAGSIGQACARRFLEAGAKVMLVDINETGLNSVRNNLSDFADSIAYTKADVSRSEDTRTYIQQTVKKWGKIDIVVSNAGTIGDISPVAEYSEDVFDKVIAVNVRSSFLACKYAVPEMKQGGSIIITSSIMGVKADPGVVAYATSKHAVIGLMRSVAKEVAPLNIRVNVVAPGPVSNDFQQEVENRLGNILGLNATEWLNEKIPMHRHADPEEVASMMLFLASDQSSFSTGSVFMVDGGMHT